MSASPSSTNTNTGRWLLIVLILLVMLVGGGIALALLLRTNAGGSASITAKPESSPVSESAPIIEAAPPSAAASDKARVSAVPPPRSARPLQVFNYGWFTVGYDNERKAGAWGRYELDGPIAHTASQPRRPAFRTEKNSDAKVVTKDYTNPGSLFERGHIVPSYAMWSRFGDDARVATFVMTNVFPQDENLNGRIWEDIEDDIAGQVKSGVVSERGYADRLRHITVVSGPVYGTASRTLPTGIPIPEACFSVIYDYDEAADMFRARAYLVPNQASLTGPTSRYASTIRDIEVATGLDFMPEGGAEAEALEVAVPVTVNW